MHYRARTLRFFSITLLFSGLMLGALPSSAESLAAVQQLMLRQLQNTITQQMAITQASWVQPYDYDSLYCGSQKFNAFDQIEAETRNTRAYRAVQGMLATEVDRKCTNRPAPVVNAGTQACQPYVNQASFDPKRLEEELRKLLRTPVAGQPPQESGGLCTNQQIFRAPQEVQPVLLPAIFSDLLRGIRSLP